MKSDGRKLQVALGCVAIGCAAAIFSEGCTTTSRKKPTVTETEQPTATITSTATTTSTPTYTPFVLVALGGDDGNNLIAGGFRAAVIASSTAGPWSASSPNPLAATFANYADTGTGTVHALGGIISSGYAAGVVSAQLSGGTIASWSVGQALPTAVAFGQAAATNNYCYLIGGEIVVSGTPMPVSDVWVSPVSSGVATGPWTQTASLPVEIELGYAWTYGGYVFATGGVTASWLNSAVYSAQIGSGGTLSTWTTTVPLPGFHLGGAATVSGSYVYVAGGIYVTSNAYPGPTLASVMSSSGTVGSWTTGPALPIMFGFGGLAAGPGALYFIGGQQIQCGGGGCYTTGTLSNTAFRASRNGTSVTGWVSDSTLPTTIQGNAAAVVP